MATIRYTKTYFNPPSRINEDMYISFKKELTKNPNYVIDPNPETFTQRFKPTLTALGICAGVILLWLIVENATNTTETFDFFDIFGVIAIFGVVLIPINLLLEGPSFATYIKQKDEYFSRMKYAIQNTSSYSEFISAFYK